MKAATLKALKGSIDKWKKIVAGTGVDNGAANCPLCNLFVDSECKGCPVAAKVKDYTCCSTPWIDWVLLHSYGMPHKAKTAKQKTAAKAELKFLRSLLPETKAKK